MPGEINKELLRQIEIAALVLEKPDYYTEFDLSELFDGISKQTIRRDAEKLREIGVNMHSHKKLFRVDGMASSALNDLICTYLALNRNDIIKNLKLIEKKFKDKTLLIFVKILKAINNKEILELHYGRNQYGETIRRYITPVTINRTGRTIYLLGFDNDIPDNLKYFIFEKIIDINFTGRKSKIKPMPDYSPLLRTSWGAFTGGQEYTVRLMFSKAKGEEIKEKIYIETQEIEEKPDCVILKMRVKMSYEFISWVMGWGASVKVLEPVELKKAILKKAKEIIENY